MSQKPFKILLLFSLLCFRYNLSIAQDRSPASEGASHDKAEHDYHDHEMHESQVPQRVQQSTSPPIIGAVVLRNNTGTTIIYNISGENVSWQTAEIKNGYTVTYQQSLYILIKIDNFRYVNYFLAPGSYSIFWNQPRNLWDISRDP